MMAAVACVAASASVRGYGIGAPERAIVDTPVAFTGAEIAAAFARIPTKPPTNRTIVDASHYEIAVARVAGRNGPAELHRDADRIFLVKAGKADMRIGGSIADPQEIAPGEIRSASGTGYQHARVVAMAPELLLSVPRGVPYQIVAEQGDVSFLVIRIR